MSRLKVRRPRVSRFRLTLALRWQSFFASWLLTRSERRLTKEQKRLTLLLQATDSSLLRLKELEQAQQMAQQYVDGFGPDDCVTSAKSYQINS